MSKIATLFFFVATLLFGVPALADQGVHYVGFKGDSSHFLIGNPPGWTYQETEAPFDAKFVNRRGTHECYIMVCGYNEQADKDDLLFECITASEALYGEDFHQNKNCNLLWVHSEDDGACIVFTYLQRNKKQYVIAATTIEKAGKSHGAICFVMQTKMNESESDEDIIGKSFDMLTEIEPYITFHP